MTGTIALITDWMYRTSHRISCDCPLCKKTKTQLKRQPHKLPKLKFDQKEINNYSVNDFELVNYNYYPSILAEMNV